MTKVFMRVHMITRPSDYSAQGTTCSVNERNMVNILSSLVCIYINSLYRPNKVTRLCYTIDGKLYFCINIPNTRHQRSVEGKVIDVYFLKRLRGSNYERCCFSTVQYTASYSDKSRPWQEWWQFGCQTDQRALSLALHITLLYTCVISDRDNVTDQY